MQPYIRPEEIAKVCQTVTHKQFCELQRIHIIRHKYFLSEKAGYDVGINETMHSWINDGYAQLFRRLFKVVTNKGQTISDIKR